MRSYRIVHLTSVHRPNDVRIFEKQSRSSVKEGFEVCIVVPCNHDYERDGVKIISVSKPKSRFTRMTTTFLQIYRKAVSLKADLYQIHDPELIPLGILLKIRGKRVVRDIHEDIPKQILSKFWINKNLRSLISIIIGTIENICTKFFDGIVTATPSIFSRFESEKTILVQNYPIIEDRKFDNLDYSHRKNRIVFIGGITKIRGIYEIVESLNYLDNNLEVIFDLVGAFDPPILEEKVKNNEGWGKVNFLGWKSRDTVNSILGESRVGLVLYHPVPNHVEAQPNKLFEYMEAGIPIVASDFPFWRKIISESEVGVLANPLNPRDIAKKITWLLKNPKISKKMGENGRRAVKEKYNWDVEVKKLISLYNKILK